MLSTLKVTKTAFQILLFMLGKSTIAVAGAIDNRLDIAENIIGDNPEVGVTGDHVDGIEENLNNNPGGNLGGHSEDNIWQEIVSRVAVADTRNISTPGELHLVELEYATIFINVAQMAILVSFRMRISKLCPIGGIIENRQKWKNNLLTLF